MTQAIAFPGPDSITEVGHRMRAWRRFRRRTQREVATAVGITQASVSNYERGLRDVTISTLLGVAHYLHVAPADLLTNDPPSASAPLEEVLRHERPRSIVTRPQLLAVLEELISRVDDEAR